MALQVSRYRLGDLDVSVYDFPEIGDELPTHQHATGTGHITVVARGTVMVFGDDWSQTNKAGDVVDLAENQNHAFRAITSGARIVNIVKHFQPA